MAWIKRHADVVDLAEAQRRLRDGNNRPAVCVTFDDGYADNNDFALPLLVRERIPCTYFVTLGNVTTGNPFPHDVVAGQPLRPNTLDDLRHWAEAGIEIGAHTRTHPDLGTVNDEARLYDEVVAAGRELADELARPIRYFAFPFGLPRNMPSRAFEMARAAGYSGICSAYGAYNFPGDDSFHLQRIHADDDFARFRNWLSIDPRKLCVSRFVPAIATPEPTLV
jgi:peptidoglycan/xylan/chitin deacetylase (PgdA/CDA1 family)